MNLNDMLLDGLLECSDGKYDNINVCPKCQGKNTFTVKLSEQIDDGSDNPPSYDTVFNTECTECGHKNVHAYGLYENGTD